MHMLAQCISFQLTSLESLRLASSESGVGRNTSRERVGIREDNSTKYAAQIHVHTIKTWYNDVCTHAQ